MGDIIIYSTLFFIFFFLASGLIHLLFKKSYFNAPFHIVNKKKGKYFLSKDCRLTPLLWKVSTWGVRGLVASALTFGFIIPSITRSCFTFIGGIVTGILTTIISVIFWHKSKVEFNKLKDELGIKLEIDEDAVNGMILKNRKKMIPINIIFTILCALISLFGFTDGDWLVGVFWAVLSIASLYELIFNSTKVKRDKNRE